MGSCRLEVVPEEVTKRIELLLKNYQERERRLTKLGFNGDVLDLTPPKAKKQIVPETGKAAI